MTEQELQEIRERLELRKYTSKLVNIPHPVTDIPWNPFKQDQEDIERLLDEVERLEKERQHMLRDGVWERDERLKQDAEIERLREEVKDYDSKVVDLLDQIHDLNAENNKLKHEMNNILIDREKVAIEEERLRKALEFYAEPISWYTRLYNDVGNVARKALEGKKNEEVKSE